MIDDKIGGGFKPIPQRAYKTLRDSSSPAWDLGLEPNHVDYWVKCPSVYSPTKPITRALALHEIAALWDFMLPDEEQLSNDSRRLYLSSLLHGPPGKLLRKFAYGPLRYLWRQVDMPSDPYMMVNRTIDYTSTTVEDQAIKDSHLKASRSDDAPIDFEMWAWPQESEPQTRARNLARLACHSFWRLNLTREALHWFFHSPDSLSSETHLNREAIIDCLTRASHSTFWDWADGSRLFFWRWRHWWKSARDGEILFHEEPPPKWFGRNLPAPSWHYELLLREKEQKLVRRRYLEPGFVTCIVPRFGVPKSEDDIRLVWDASRNGVNSKLYAPSFWMPQFRTLTDLIIKWLPCSVSDYFAGNIPQDPVESDWRIPHQSDMDVGEMFLNYMMHYTERHTFGARIITGEGESEVQQVLRFNRLLFGGTPCPYIAVQGHSRAMELVLGNPTDPANPLHWVSTITNWPYTLKYDPSMPWVIRVRADGEMAAGSPAFVDDGRTAGVTREICHAVAHRVSTYVNYLGEQNASRKRRPTSRTPGAWTGKMLWTNEPHPKKGVLPQKWQRQRADLLSLHSSMLAGEDPDRKLFLSATCRGMSQTEVYTDLRPYYKSFYNALEAWRPDRDDDGWRRDDTDDEDLDTFDLVNQNLSPPSTVKITPEAARDLDALVRFYESEEPEFLLVRPRGSNDVAYFGGDASAAAYGSGCQLSDGTVLIWMGNWTRSETDRGSNWREAFNLARILLQEIRAGNLDGKEVWMATDNLVWALIANKGMSKRKGLSDIVRDIKIECRKHEVFWHPFHISGKRMIKIGFDGLSRGDFDSGVMLGRDIRTFVPLGVSAVDFEDNQVITWLKSWMDSDYTPPLNVNDWFYTGHQPGVHVWAPPPAGALIALEEIAQAKLKRPFEVAHVFVCPRLLYHEVWRRRFNKEMDFWLIIESNSPLWPNSCCEPLVFGISFPLRTRRPWKLRRVPPVVELGRRLQEVFKNGAHMGERDLLRKLWKDPWGFFGL